GFAHGGDAGEVPFDVRREYRDAGVRKPLGEHLEGYGLASAGCTGDEAVTVGERQREIFRLGALADENRAGRIDARHGLPLAAVLAALLYVVVGAGGSTAAAAGEKQRLAGGCRPKTLQVSGIRRQFLLAGPGACLIYGQGPGDTTAGSAWSLLVLR